MAHIHSIFHLVGGAARPRLKLPLNLRVLNLDVHDNVITLEKRDSSAINPRLEVPPIERLTLIRINRSIVIEDRNGPVVQIHIQVVGIQSCTEIAPLGYIVHGEGFRALEGGRLDVISLVVQIGGIPRPIWHLFSNFFFLINY